MTADQLRAAIGDAKIIVIRDSAAELAAARTAPHYARAEEVDVFAKMLEWLDLECEIKLTDDGTIAIAAVYADRAKALARSVHQFHAK